LAVAIDLEGREFNGRWYTDVKAWRVTPMEQEGAPRAIEELPPPGPDDLPF